MNADEYKQEDMFQRLILAKGRDAFDKLQEKKVLLLGCGAVGGYALEQMVRCGIKKFVLVDFDVFELSNLNRQILCTLTTLGRSKVDVASERLLQINPDA